MINRGNPRFPLAPSRSFGLGISLSIFSNKFFYEKFTEKSWVPGGTGWMINAAARFRIYPLFFMRPHMLS